MNLTRYLYEAHMKYKRTSYQINATYISYGFPHDDVIKWNHFPRYWPFVRGINHSRLIPRTKASDAELWCFLICIWINGWVNNREAGYLRRYRANFDVIVMYEFLMKFIWTSHECSIDFVSIKTNFARNPFEYVPNISYEFH